MLKYLKIENFLIIENQELNFHDNYNVIIGETGSGKSIILKALAFVLGKRLDGKIIRPGCKKSTISAEFDITKHSHTIRELAKYEIDHDNSIIIRRIIKDDSSSKIFINGQIVSNQIVKNIFDNLIEIQTQNEKNNLYDNNYILNLIDNFHGSKDLIKSVKTIFLELKKLKDQLEQLHEQSKKIEIETRYYTQIIEDLSPINPTSEEFETLTKRLQNIKQYSHYKNSLQKISQNFNNDNAILSLMNDSIKEIYNLREYDQEFVDSKNTELSELFDSLSDLSCTFDDRLSDLLSDNGNEDEMRETFSQYKSLARKYRTSEPALESTLMDAKAQLDQLGTLEEQITSTNSKIIEVSTAFLKQAETLSLKRLETAKTIESNIKNHLSSLNMQTADINIKISKRGELDWNIFGINNVEFLISTNPGQPFTELKNTISGGEMSRILLAIKLCFSSKMALNTIIFDEIDAGIGGKTAELISKKLELLSKSTQIIAITHNETLSKSADLKLKIVKKHLNNQTFSQIEAA
ncbi:MAG: AAA family ATPase [Rickettsiales bacterium]|jgi:DNA repair protein RecN (Recombination protein N)|nr:AAA family ATPase [Rickettsiales bacterium]